MTEEHGTQVIEWNVNDRAIAEVAEQCKDIDAYQDIDAAKAAKKGLTKMRTTLAEAHKATKAEALAFGRKVDSEKNRLLAMIREIEDPISQQLDDIKNAEIQKEQLRLDYIAAAIDRIEAHASDRYSLTLEELADRQSALAAIDITEDVFQEQTERAALTKQDAEMKLRLAVDSEKTRIKEEAEKAAIEEENRALREKLAEQEEAQRQRDAADALVRAEEREVQRKADAARQAELERQQAELEAEKQRLADEEAARLQTIYDAEQKAEAEKLAALQAPDAKKVEDYADLVKFLVDSKPVMGSTKGCEIIYEATAILTELEYTLREGAKELK